MKKIPNIITLLLLGVIPFTNCKKEKFGDGRAENLPSSVELGQSQIFINGEQVAFLSNFVKWTDEGGVSGSFNRTDNGIADDLQFYFDPIQIGSFDPKIQFGRTKGDSNFEQFKQVERDSAFLVITFIDTIKMEVQGHFEARFEKSVETKLTRKKKYPDNLLIQCVFNEKYTKF